MKFWSAAASAAVSAAMCFLIPRGASAQSGLMTASSSGLTATVVGVAYAQGQVSTEMIIKNTNNFRVYLTDARTDGGQNGFLGSGGILNAPFPQGLPFCNGSYSGCSTNPNEILIDKFSYIDPGNSLGLSMQYYAQQPPSNPDTITFSVTMMARFAKSSDDSSPDDAGPVREITLSFPYLSFSRKN